MIVKLQFFKRICGLLLAACLGASPGLAAESRPISADYSDLLTRYLLAEIAGGRNDFDLAVGQLLSLANETKNLTVVKRAVEVSIYAKRYREAAEAAELWLSIEPNSADAKNIADQLLVFVDEDTPEAKARLVTWLAEDPKILSSRLLALNNILSEIKEKERLQSLVNEVTAPYLSMPEAYFARAQAAFNVKQFDAANSNLDMALKLRSDWSPAVLFKARLLREKSPLESSRLLGEYAARYPNNYDLQVEYARSLLVANKLDEASQLFAVLVERRPEALNVRNAYALLLMQRKSWALAKPQVEYLLKNSNNGEQRAQNQFYLARIESNLGNTDAAIDAYLAIEDTRGLEDMVAMSDRLYQAGNKVDADRIFEKLAQNPDLRIQVRVAQAHVLVANNELSKASLVLESALHDAPDNSLLLYESALVHERQQHYALMEVRLLHLLKLEPDNSQALNALGYSLADRGVELARAHKLLTKAVELAPADSYITDSMGWLLYRQGRHQDALQWLQKAYDLQANAEIAVHIGEAYLADGNTGKAKETTLEALKQFPDDKGLQALRKRLEDL